MKNKLAIFIAVPVILILLCGGGLFVVLNGRGAASPSASSSADGGEEGDNTSSRLAVPWNVRIEGEELKWNSVDNALGYKVSVDDDAERSVTALSYVIPDTIGAGVHVFKVKATGGVGYTDSAYSSGTTYTKYEQLVIPEASVAVDAQGVVRWGAIEHAGGYTVSVERVGGGVILNTQTGVDTYSYNLSNLKLTVGEYTVKLKAIGGGYYLSSEELVIPYEGRTLVAPAGLSVDSAGTLLSWERVLNATGYKVNIDGAEESVSGISNTSYLMSTALSAGSHTFRVKAVGGGSYIDSDYTVITHTKLAAPVVSITGTNLSWNPISGAGGYYITVTRTDAAATPLTATVTATTYNLSGLDLVLGGGYDVKVKALPAAGYIESVDSNSQTYIRYSDNLVFTQIGADSYAVGGNQTNTDAVIFIPPTYNGKPVTSIGASAFGSHTSLTSITIPNSVTSIGDRAFSYCLSLTEINVETGNGEYKSIDGNLYGKYGTRLIQYAVGKTATAFNVPASVWSIDDYAFVYCTSLTSIIIPNSVENIGEYAFAYCTELTSIIIPNSVENIGEYAFYACTKLTSITIPNTVLNIGQNAFYGCDALTIYVRANMKPNEWSDTWMGNVPAERIRWDYAALAAPVIFITGTRTNLSWDSIPGAGGYYITVTRTDAAATPLTATVTGNTYNLSGLDLVLGGGYDVTVNTLSAAGYIASEYSEVVHYVESKGLVFVANGANSYEVGNNQGNTASTIIIPATYDGKPVTEIGEDAFLTCTSLVSIIIPNTVSSIHNNAFEKCSRLENVIFGSGSSLKVIGNRVFYHCAVLTEISLPNGLRIIGANAFMYCTSLTSIIIPNSVTSIGQNAFYACTSLTINVRASTKPAGWDDTWMGNVPDNRIVWGYTGN